ncbi:hypothetical protein SESBI_20788 [Sesbania bispinosa]|nr:hypothetical protein SESBI_20788 [Sesbania bispinosa]
MKREHHHSRCSPEKKGIAIASEIPWPSYEASPCHTVCKEEGGIMVVGLAPWPPHLDVAGRERHRAVCLERISCHGRPRAV